MNDPVSPKSRLVALILCLFFGWLGIHRFYVGKIGTGILMIVLCFGFFGLWVFVDFIMIAIGAFRDKKGRRLFKWFEAGSI
jgi:TM2 domain-containing membrane protein YozV